jgi:hypothetical protein
LVMEAIVDAKVEPHGGHGRSTPAGRMIFTVLGAVAELERLLIAAGPSGPEECTLQRKAPRKAPRDRGCR